MTPEVRSIPVLETKLYIPRWPAGLVARPRLIERVSEGAKCKLMVVSAPAGFGKTTLFAEWLAQRHPDEAAVGWVSLDIGDNDPALFWTCVVRALQKVHPNVGDAALRALHDESAPPVSVLTSLLNEVSVLDHEVVLIFDDYHVIETPTVHTALAFVLDHLPPRMHIILATRADPPLPLARMRARGEVAELRASDLRFTADEASAFLQRVMNLDLQAEDVASLEQRTEGWIAGLKLAALSLQTHGDAATFIRSFSGDNRYIADYLIEEVLSGQPERTRRFLMATSILERLSASLCDAVTGEKGSQDVLDTLEKSNLFVVALDDRREWYRYHHLFAEVLQTHAAREDAAEVRELHRRASRWYEEHDTIADAVRHAEAASDFERVAELLERRWPPKDRSYQSARWLGRVRALPEAIVHARPLLNMGYAWALLNAGELEAADLRLREVAASDDATSNPDLARELATARVYLAQSRGDSAGTAEHARQLLDLVPDGDLAARATASALLALAYWGNGELDAAHDTFTSALATMRAAGATLDVIRGMFVLGDIRAMQGRLRDAVRTYQAGLDAAAPHRNAEIDELYLGLAEVDRERGELLNARALLVQLDETMARAEHKANRHRWCRAMARVAEADRQLDVAFALLEEAETCHRRDPLPVVQTVAALKARIRIAQGDVAYARRWANEHDITQNDELSFIREHDHITLARLLIATNELEQAAALLERITAAATAGGRLGSVIESRALHALVKNRTRDGRAAHDAIANALELAEPEGYVRVFVDAGLEMRDLLRQAAARGIAGAYTRSVLVAFEGAAPTASIAKPAGATAAPVQLLTSRELEILRLIAAGMRNQEIAQQLFISPATVKRHIANVYNKLDAKHRTDALKRAQVLNLL